MWAMRSPAAGPPRGGAAAVDDLTTLFEGLVPVVVLREGKEPATEVFMVAVMATAAGASGAQEGTAAGAGGKRMVHLRITSPTDAFLLHTATVSEDEYPEFRERNGLRFDFARLPSVLVSLFEERGGEPVSTLSAVAAAAARQEAATTAAHPSAASPSPSGAGSLPDALGGGVVSRSCRLQLPGGPNMQGRFQFCQADRVRDSEVLGMIVSQEDDAGQKRHLAYRAAALLRELAAATDELKSTSALLHERTSVYERTLETTKAERDGFEKQLLQMTGDMKLQHEQQQRALREAHQQELHNVSSSSSEQLAAATAQHAAEIKSLRDALLKAEKQRDALADAKSGLERTSRGLAGEREELETGNSRLAARVQALDAEVTAQAEELRETHRVVNQKSLQIVGLEERLKAANDLLETEKTRHAGAAEQLKETATDAERWAAQNQRTQKLVEEKEQDLKKAQYIIKTIHAKFRDSKTRKEQLEEAAEAQQHEVAALSDKLKSTEASLQTANAALVEKRGEILTLANENEALQKSLTEANACIEYHHRNSRFAFSKSVGGSSLITATAGSSPVPRTSATTASPLPSGSGAAATTGGLFSSRLANGIAAEAAHEREGTATMAATRSPAGLLPSAAAKPRPSPTPSPASNRAEHDAASARARGTPSAAGRPSATSLLTASPNRATNLVNDSQALWSVGCGDAASGGNSNFFVSGVSGPIGTTA
eukprot:TRINITY_DN7164_c1_g1_i1.p1 TRINITY_DN7164_c1_g1~~TRINITY_DN7164_c1_g1_i1.p1  ORF type:complete len:715 (+),score=219.57 TRINITY_DN7164_c1_g1_i1:44-2188(+)